MNDYDRLNEEDLSAIYPDPIDLLVGGGWSLCGGPDCYNGQIREFEPADPSVGAPAVEYVEDCDECGRIHAERSDLPEREPTDHHYGNPVAGPRQYKSYGGGQ